jgi:hypothetical protein
LCLLFSCCIFLKIRNPSPPLCRKYFEIIHPEMAGLHVRRKPIYPYGRYYHNRLLISYYPLAHIWTSIQYISLHANTNLSLTSVSDTLCVLHHCGTTSTSHKLPRENASARQRLVSVGQPSLMQPWMCSMLCSGSRVTQQASGRGKTRRDVTLPEQTGAHRGRSRNRAVAEHQAKTPTSSIL